MASYEAETKMEKVKDYKISPASNASSLNLKNINFNCFVVLSKCPYLQAGITTVCINGNANGASKVDYNTTAIKKEGQLDFNYDNSHSTEAASKNLYQNGMNESFHIKKEIHSSDSSVNLVIKKENQIDIGYDNSSCTKINFENQYPDLKSECFHDEEIDSSFDFVIKDESQVESEYNNSHGTEISDNQNLKTEFLDYKEIYTSLDLLAKEENQVDPEFDVGAISEIDYESQYQDLKSGFFNDEKEIYSLLSAAEMETNKSILNQSVKQENRSNIFRSNSISPIRNHDIIVKSENFIDNDKKKMKLRHNNRSTTQNTATRPVEDEAVIGYEVIKITHNGKLNFIFKSLHCPYTSTYRYKIIQHCKTHMKNKSYNCLDCNFTAKCLFVLKFHKTTHIENMSHCSLCPFSTTSLSTLKSHKRMKHKFSKLHKRSVINDANFNSRTYSDNYKEHMETSTKRETKLVKRKATLNSPLKKKTKLVKRKATLNSPLKKKTKLLKRKASRISTSASKHSNARKKDFKCNNCKFVTDKVKDLSRHEQIHIKSPENDKGSDKDHTEKDFEKHENHLLQTSLSCSSCPFTTSLKIALLKHKQSHLSFSEKVFKCSECSFLTTRYKCLISHLMNHAYKYLYKCAKCNFSTNNKAKLRSHKVCKHFKRIREKISRPRENLFYICQKCDYSCSNKHLYNQHSVTHFENKLLKCAHCDYDTNFKGNLVKHISTHVSEYRQCLP